VQEPETEDCTLAVSQFKAVPGILQKGLEDGGAEEEVMVKGEKGVVGGTREWMYLGMLSDTYLAR